MAGAALHCAPVRRLTELLPAPAGAKFDVVTSTGLFDYLPDDAARELLGYMVSLTRPGGSVAICNFAPEDRSRIVKDWLDWRLI